MSNKQITAVQEAIHLIKQDYEANGRLRLAFVLQALNKAKEKEKQQVIDALHYFGIENAQDYYKETYGGQNNEQ
jgi:ABC-type methionine transport system ATPase subunit